VTIIPRSESANDEDEDGDCNIMPLLLTRSDDDSSDDEDEDENDIGHFYDNGNKAASSGSDIAPPAQEAMATYLKLLLLAGLVLSITSFQGRVNNATNAITRKIFEPMWNTIVIQLFWENTVAWDILRFLMEKTVGQEEHSKNKNEKVISRRLTRKFTRINRKRLKGMTSLYFFAGTWLIMTGSVMVLKQTYPGHQPEHPFTHVRHQLESTYHHIERLDKVFTLTPHTFMQYQAVQANQWMLELNPKVEASKKDKEHEIDHHCEEFFDTYHDMPFRSESNEEFLDARDDLEIYEKESARYLMDLDSIYRTRHIIQ
jgi:hypothetical protein